MPNSLQASKAYPLLPPPPLEAIVKVTGTLAEFVLELTVTEPV